MPLARIGTVQPYGVMMVVSPATGLVEHVSSNVSDILGITPDALLGNRPTVAFSNADSVARLEDILRSGRRYFDNPVPLTARGQRFEAVCHVRDPYLFIEIEPFVPAEHDYETMVEAALDTISKQTTVSGLYDAAVKMMYFVTRWDRVKLYRYLSHGHGVVVAEHHAPGSKLPTSFLGYHFAASDTPENAKDILLTGKTRQKPTQAGSVPLLTRGSGGDVQPSGDAVDMTDCWLRGIHPCDNGYNRNLGVASNIIFPVCVDGTLWGLFVVHNKDEAFLNYDSRIVIEQLTMMFVSRLIEVEAMEARIPEREAAAGSMLSMVRSTHGLLSMICAEPGAPESAVHLQTMHAASRYVTALAPTFVSGSGTDVSNPMRGDDRFAGDLLRLADADGAAVVRAGRGAHVHLIGSTPDAMTVRGIATMFGTRLPKLGSNAASVFATDALGDLLPLGDETKQIGCGLLAVPICDRGDMILWFRRERVVDATWAGRPPTQAELNSEAMFRSRSDFAAHRAPLAGASRPWLSAEIALAARFGIELGNFWRTLQAGGAAASPDPGGWSGPGHDEPSEAIASPVLPTGLQLEGIGTSFDEPPPTGRRGGARGSRSQRMG